MEFDQENIKALVEEAVAIGVNLTLKQSELLFRYVKLLLKWNKVYSLTAITDVKEVITYHIFDGLSVIKIIENYKSIIDVGSGMGIPGIIIAICCPHLSVSVIDSNRKKSAFLRQVKIELLLNNLQVIESRVEKFNPSQKFEAAISRAFAKATLFIKLTSHLLDKDGIFLLMKSQNVQEELNELPFAYSHKIISLTIPTISKTRCLLQIQKTENPIYGKIL